MRVVMAPDSYSGTMTAVEAAEEMARAWAAVRPDDEVLTRPMSDGGLGLVEVVAHARPAATAQRVEVADARGIATDATWLLLEDGTAVVETAQAIGLHDLEPAQRDPLRTTSYGVGQLLAAAAGTPGVQRIVIGLGGSATVDGGAGMVSALTGHALRRADGNGVRVGGRWVAEVATLRAGWSLALPPLTLACDVTNPLLGLTGAAHVFGPQKGASPAAVEELEAALGRYADVLERTLLGGPWRDRPGSGAAGGLGFSLMAVLGAECRSGARLVADLVGLDLAQVDLVLTGEGRLDAQTRGGKAPAVVAEMARDAGARTAVVAGSLEEGAGSGFDLVEELGEDGEGDPLTALGRAVTQVAGRAG